MNAQSLKSKINNLGSSSNIDKNILLKFYIFERFVERLSLSKYKETFIVKGGYYLANIFGFHTRTTIDIDYCLRDMDLELENIKNIIGEIISIEIEDNTTLTLEKIDFIREEDQYGGYRIFLKVKIDNINERFHIDVATGDIITPKAIIFSYKKLFEDEEIKMLAYNFETILAEKVETVLSKGEVSSRMKDYLDIFIIKKLHYEKLNTKNISKAFKNTFEYRKSEEYLQNYKEILKAIENNKNVLKYWENYRKKKNIHESITIKSIIEDIRQIMNEITVE